MLTLIGSILFSAAIAQAMPTSSFHKLHLDLEMTSYEYDTLLRNSVELNEVDPTRESEDSFLEKYLEYGKRNLQWVELINSKRTPENRISLTSKASTKGYPITAPRFLNFTSIKQDWATLQALLPKALARVIFEGEEMTPESPVSDRELIEWLFQVDQAYQASARYRLLEPYKGQLIQLAANDVRPYLDIKNDLGINEKLANWANLPEGVKQSLSKKLIKICRYSGPKSNKTCSRELNEAISANQVTQFKDKYLVFGEDLYQSFFQIPRSRPDTQWVAGEINRLIIPFTNPQNSTILDFLKFNIEDEFRWNNWKLELNFVEERSEDTTHVVFVPGTTPNVDGLAGSKITMDANSPLSEYNVQWTIRHEYGHTLGLPDCYLEFYDVDIESYVSYQLDITNLMCSRRGHFQQIHFDELHKVYAH